MPGKGLNPYQRYYWSASSAYDLPQAACVSIGFVLDGELDVPRFGRAIDAVVNRHEQLKSVFLETQAGVRRFPQSDVSGVLQVGDAPFDLAQTEASIEALCRIPFDLSVDIPFRAYLKPVGQGRYLFALIIHHVVVDSWSLEVILDDLARAYARAESGGSGPLLSPLTFDHETLAAPLGADERRLQAQFWRESLEGAAIPVIPGLVDGLGEQGKSTFDVITPRDEVREALDRLCQRLDVTPFVVYTAVASIALARFCATADLVIQTNVTPRWTEGTETVVSYLSARIPLRLRVAPEVTPDAHVLEVADALYGTFENVGLNIGEILAESSLKQGLPIHIGAESPFEGWDLENVAVSQVQLPDFQPWPLFLWVPAATGHSFIKLQYQADRISAEHMGQLKRLLDETLERFVLSERQAPAVAGALNHLTLQ
ncbi:condensation domain-containing protein [Pseudomonas sp. KCJK8993]|uniref:condensation domain-containing protein n=1 Tax=Pseudomonas sp. KCJK8993 TaxID=3344565 RepID=UPI0039057EC0